MDLADDLGVDAHRLDGLGRALRRADLEAELSKGLGELLHLFLVLVGNREEDAALRRDVDARADDGLVEGARVVVVDAHDLARRLHLRSEGDVDIRHLREGEDRCLDGDVRFRRHEARLVAEFL